MTTLTLRLTLTLTLHLNPSLNPNIARISTKSLLSIEGGQHGPAADGSGAPWRRLTGLDISKSAVARAAKRLQVPP